MTEQKKKKFLSGFGIGLVIGLVTVFGILTVFVIYFFTGGPVQVNKDAARYAEVMHKYRFEVVGQIHTGLFTFPETIPQSAFENGSAPEFYFSYKDTWDDPTCEAYLKCHYSDADYQSELERLKNGELVLSDGSGRTIVNRLQYEESERFRHPVYMAMDGYDHAFEYAMDLGNNEIAYVYTAFRDYPMSLRKVPGEYLPDDFAETIRVNARQNSGFNAYIVEKTDEFTAYDYGDKFE